MKYIWTVLPALIACVSSPAFADDEPARQQAARLETQVTVRLNYLLYLPPDYEERDAWPLMLFLHGAGERGDDLELVKVHGPPKLIDAGEDFPFIVVSPQCPDEMRWEPIELVALLDEIEGRYNVDPDRVYVTGLSMGGFGTWELASYAPERLAAIAPICGGGETYWVKRFAHLPVWAFHGALDEAVPLERSQLMVDELTEKGGHPRLTIYEEAEHDSWTETYDNPDLYTWLLEQRRIEVSESDEEPQ